MRARQCSGLNRKEQRKLPRRNQSFAEGNKRFAKESKTLPKEQIHTLFDHLQDRGPLKADISPIFHEAELKDSNQAPTK